MVDCTLCGQFHNSMLDCPIMKTARDRPAPRFVSEFPYDKLSSLIRYDKICSNCKGDHDTADCPKRFTFESILICSNCGGSGHKARDCPKRINATKPSYVFIENDSPFIELCPECHSHKGHSPGCSRNFRLIDLEEHAELGLRQKFGLGNIMPQLAQITDVMQAYQALRSQFEAQYLGGIMPLKLRQALDTIGEELSDRLMRDAMNETPKVPHYKMF